MAGRRAAIAMLLLGGGVGIAFGDSFIRRPATPGHPPNSHAGSGGSSVANLGSVMLMGATRRRDWVGACW